MIFNPSHISSTNSNHVWLKFCLCFCFFIFKANLKSCCIQTMFSPILRSPFFILERFLVLQRCVQPTIVYCKVPPVLRQHHTPQQEPKRKTQLNQGSKIYNTLQFLSCGRIKKRKWNFLQKLSELWKKFMMYKTFKRNGQLHTKT